MYLVDTISRAYLSQSLTDTPTKNEVDGIHAVDYLAISEKQLSEIKQKTAKDPTLQTLQKRDLKRMAWKQQLSTKGSLRVCQCQRRTCRTRRNHL